MAKQVNLTGLTEHAARNEVSSLWTPEAMTITPSIIICAALISHFLTAQPLRMDSPSPSRRKKGE